MEDLRLPRANGVLGLPQEVPLLDEEHSCNLLMTIAFPDRIKSVVLEELGKRITMVCRGLPLAIVTMGKLLAWIGRTSGDWYDVLNLAHKCKDYDDLMEFLVSLTYDGLPQVLKACLLFLGNFPQNYEIPVLELINLWIAEGYFEESGLKKPLEEVAEDCLMQLIERRNVSLCDWRSNGRVKTCRVSEVFCDFIIKKAGEEKHFHVINKLADDDGFLDNSCSHNRRLGIHKNIFSSFKETSHYIPESALHIVCTLLYTGPQDEYPLRAWLDFKLLRVLDAIGIRFYGFPPEIVKLIWLSYLAFSYNELLPSSICKLCGLQFLIILRYQRIKRLRSPSYLPMEIWSMEELRHLQVMRSDLPGPCRKGDNGRAFLENLQTLLGVSTHSCTPSILKQIPNLKKLEVEIGQDDAHDFFSHLSILSRLELLKCVFVQYPKLGMQTVGSITPEFPPGPKKLTLNGCGFSWECRQAIALLLNLEVFKLKNYAFRGGEWTLGETDEFVSLKLLEMEDLNVECWMLSVELPGARSLGREALLPVAKDSSRFWQIETLETIEAVDCRTSILASTRSIEEEQNDAGIGGLESEVYYSFEDAEDLEL